MRQTASTEFYLIEATRVIVNNISFRLRALVGRKSGVLLAIYACFLCAERMSVSSAESDKEYCYPVDEILVHRRSSPLQSLIRRVSMNVY